MISSNELLDLEVEMGRLTGASQLSRFLPKRLARALCSLLAMLAAHAALAADAPTFAPAGLIPSGLSPGDTFFVVFAGSQWESGAASSSSYFAYGPYVATLNPDTAKVSGWTTLFFHADGSFTLVTAFDGNNDRPIYNRNGDKIADDRADMFDGSLDAPILYDESGRIYSGTSGGRVWTGFSATGFLPEFLIAQLGTLGDVTVGDASRSDSGWAEAGQFDSIQFVNDTGFYVLSPLLTVPAPPTIANFPGDSLTYNEGEGAQLLDQGAVVTVTAGDSADYDGGSLTVEIVSGGDSAEEVLAIDTGSVVLSAGMTAGSSVSIGGTAIGSIRAGATGNGEQLAVDFNSDATAARVQVLVQALTYENTDLEAPTTGARTVRLTITDALVSANVDATVSVNGVNDAPVLDDTQSPSFVGIGEDAGDDDGSGADGDDDLSDNANNPGTTVAALVVDGSITDVDGSAVEAIAVTAVDNSDGLWQYSTDNGATWNNFSATTGSAVDLSSAARLLDGTLTGAATQRLRFVPDAAYTGSASLTFRAWDKSTGSAGSTADTSTVGGISAFSTATDTASVTVFAVNDLPVISNLNGTPVYIEGASTGVVLDSNVAVSDEELNALNGGSGNYAGASLSIERNGSRNSVDTFSIVTGGNLTVAGSNILAGGNVIASFDTATAGRVTVTYQDNGTVPTAALVNEVLQAIRYANTNNDPAANVQLDWTFSDGNAGNAQGPGDNPGTASGSTTVSVTNINDAPTLTATGQNPTYIEGGAAVDLYSAVTADTIESINTSDRFTALTMTISNVFDGADELLRFDGSDLALSDGSTVVGTATNSLTVSVSVTGTTATVSFSGATLTSAQMQTLVDALAYVSTSDNPTAAGNRVFTITGINDNGGTADGGVESSTPNLTSTVSLTAVNDPPVLGNIDGGLTYLTPVGLAAALDALLDATVADVDSADHNGGSLVIVDNGSNNTANGSWGVSGVVTSGGDSTVAAGETVQVSGVSIGTVDATSDGQGGNTLEIALNANASTARIETLVRSLTQQFGAGSGMQTFTMVLNDGDGTANSGDEDGTASFTINLSERPVVGNLDGDSVSTTVSTKVAIDAGGNGNVSYAQSANFAGGRLLINRTGLAGEFSLTGSGSTGLAAGTTIGDADDTLAAGELIFLNGANIASVDGTNDGQGANDLILDLTASATPAAVQALIQDLNYSSVNGGTHSFTLTLETSPALAATSAPVGFSIQVEAIPVNTVPGAQAGVDGTAKAIIGVSVADADSASLTTMLTAANGTISVNTGGTAGVAGNNGGSVTLTGSAAEINAALAGLSYTPAVNSFGVQTLSINTSDGTYSDSDDISITVSDRPNLDNLSGSVTFGAGSTGVLLDSGGDAAVTDLDNANFDGGSLTASISAGAVPAEDLLTLDTGGVVALAGTAANDNVTVDGEVVGTLGNAIGTGNDLVVNFNANATAARVGTLLQALRYENAVTDTPTAGSRTVDLTLDDGEGNSIQTTVTVEVTVPPPTGGGSGGSSSSSDSPRITGNTENTGTLTNLTITAGGQLSGGSLAGTINNSGTVRNVQLLPGTTLSGGNASGDLIGNSSQQPAVFTNVRLSDAFVENVVIGAGSTLSDNVTVGRGVRFASPDSIPANLDLSGAFRGIPSASDPNLPSAIDLSHNLIASGSAGGDSVLESFLSLEAFSSVGVGISQNPDNGELLLQGAGIQATLRPVAVTQAASGTEPGVYFDEDGNVVIVNETGQQVVTQPAVADVTAMRNQLNGFSLEQDAIGNLNFTGSGSEAYIGRPGLVSGPATRSSTPGTNTYIKDRPANVPGAVFTYEDENGELQEQEIVPVPADWSAMKQSLLDVSGVESASISVDGVITILLNGQRIEAVADFMVNESTESNGGDGFEFAPAGDINGDGIEDFLLTFASGETQIIYILPL